MATRRRPIPVDDHRVGHSPAEQLRRDLERFRAAGRPFDEAWRIAYQRIRWPHHTLPKQEWKAILAGQRHLWHAAYERDTATRVLEATGRLTAA
jgi:hypothetical protein